jgi:hypothetical protein
MKLTFICLTTYHHLDHRMFVQDSYVVDSDVRMEDVELIQLIRA